MRIKIFGIAPGLANARLPGRAKFANAPPSGLTRGTNAPQEPGGAWAQLELTDDYMITTFLTNTRTLRFKIAFTIAFFATVTHNYFHKQRTLKHRNKQNWIEIHQSKITNHDLLNPFRVRYV